jgi:hypothetical protein
MITEMCGISSSGPSQFVAVRGQVSVVGVSEVRVPATQVALATLIGGAAACGVGTHASRVVSLSGQLTRQVGITLAVVSDRVRS